MISAEFTCVLHGDKLLSEESFYLKLFSSIANKLDRFMSHVSVKLSIESIRQNTKYSIFKGFVQSGPFVRKWEKFDREPESL